MDRLSLSEHAPLLRYPYDFYSPLGSILPVHGTDGASLAGWLGDGNEQQGAQLLFEHALQLMCDANPFDRLLHSADKDSYERGECAAENIYIASVLIAQRIPAGETVAGLPVDDAALYRAALESVREAVRSDGEDRVWMLALMRHANESIYASNKYTPADDASQMRSRLLDRVRSGEDGERKYQDWIRITLQHLKQQGIRYAQIAAGLNDIDALNAQIAAFNQREGTEYRALVHVPSSHANDQRFAQDLDAALSKVLDKALRHTIGLDVLGVKNRQGRCDTLFDLLRERRDTLSQSIQHKHTRKLVVHIHNGEGAHTAADHRSLIGHYLANGNAMPDGDFYQTLAASIGHCARTVAGQDDNFPDLLGELFGGPLPAHRGCQLHRFDTHSERSAALAAYHDKRNAMAVTESFERPLKKGSDANCYDFLTGTPSPYVFRLGNTGHYSDFMVSKFPMIAFDTHHGVDANALAGEASEASLSHDALSRKQLAFFVEASRLEGPVDTAPGHSAAADTLRGYLQEALGPMAPCMDESVYQRYARLVAGMLETSTQAAQRYRAMTTVFAIFHGWRSYLLATNGQGVERGDMQDAFARTTLQLAQHLMQTGQTVLPQRTLIDIQELLLSIADGYWSYTVGKLRDESASAATAADAETSHDAVAER